MKGKEFLKARGDLRKYVSIEKEYCRIFGVEFEITVDAPLTHVKVHPLVWGDLLNTMGDPNQILDIYIHKAVLPEITLEEKVEQIQERKK